MPHHNVRNMVYPKNYEDHKSANIVADYFLLKVDTSYGDTISNLKMQKLCYFSQAASLSIFDSTIFDDEIQAWAHGPVVKTLYNRFKVYGWQSIDPTNLKTQPLNKLDQNQQKLLDQVWNLLSFLSAKDLEHLSHMTLGKINTNLQKQADGVIMLFHLRA